MYQFLKYPPIICLLLLTLVVQSSAREYFNDKEVPESIEDIKAIEVAMLKHLERVRSSTVCIQMGGGSGSGVIVSEDGLVMTAAHVIAATNTKMTVVREDGTELEAISLGLDSFTDAGLLQITTPGKYPYVEVERKPLSRISTALGDWVFSLGHSGGFDKERGSVVRLGRIVRIVDSPPTFQSDCTLIGGDSGGPLFNMQGVLIGIHSRVGKVLDQNMHVMTADFFSKEKQDDKYSKWERMQDGEFIGKGPFAQKPVPGSAFMGVELEEVEKSLKVISLDKEGSAARAGVKVGDIVKKVNEQGFESKEKLREYFKSQSSGETVVLEIDRFGETIKLEFRFGKR